eukprot:TRINITY_DN16005_c0_g1_i2.p1 TRINITY_DN16005_c0_g1~~TRINITY_DN16005_c0_g1_i2.p1  ORF type:complete len:431 (-),score=97.67 TRINITY_DN16005_c0_g1_i2:1398-2690(-)
MAVMSRGRSPLRQAPEYAKAAEAAQAFMPPSRSKSPAAKAAMSAYHDACVDQHMTQDKADNVLTGRDEAAARAGSVATAASAALQNRKIISHALATTDAEQRCSLATSTASQRLKKAGEAVQLDANGSALSSRGNSLTLQRLRAQARIGRGSKGGQAFEYGYRLADAWLQQGGSDVRQQRKAQRRLLGRLDGPGERQVRDLLTYAHWIATTCLTLTTEELLALLIFGISPSLVDQARKQIYSGGCKLHGHSVTDGRSFYNALDAEGCGGLYPGEVSRGLRLLGIQASTDEVNTFVSCLKVNEQGIVEMREVLRWLGGLQTLAPESPNASPPKVAEPSGSFREEVADAALKNLQAAYERREAEAIATAKRAAASLAIAVSPAAGAIGNLRNLQRLGRAATQPLPVGNETVGRQASGMSEEVAVMEEEGELI